MNKKVELLAPAGNMESLKAAIENGADAVYLGGKLFNAREYADNFDSEQLKEAVYYAHVRGANVYFTMNILISDDEMKQAVECAENAWMAGIDGIIVQDIGFASVLRNNLPDLSLHASTQMTIYNLQGVEELEKLGFKRIVLARELPFEEIKYIAENTNIELEVFVHGALCICYSGQCLMSSMIGGRSGNRGKCAQPCRLPYELVESNKTDNWEKVIKSCGRYILSPKDLCLVSELGRFAYSGVSSIKIEGRMKNPEYVATVVRIYRKYLDRALMDFNGTGENGAALELEKVAVSDKNAVSEKDTALEKVEAFSIDSKDMKELTQIFNRGGFTSGYFRGKQGRDMMSYEKPKNWGLYLGTVQNYNPKRNAITLKIEEDIGIGDGIEVWNGENESPSTIVSEILINSSRVQRASKGNTVTISSIKGRINKGDRVYKTSDRELGETARKTFENNLMRKVPLNCTVEIRSGRQMSVTAEDDIGNRVSVVSESIPEKALNKAATVETVVKQFDKTGGTPFIFKNINVELDEGLSVSLSKLNELRRKVLEEMEVRRGNKYPARTFGKQVENEKRIYNFPGNSRNGMKNFLEKRFKVSVLFYKWREDLISEKLEADRLYINVSDFLNAEKREIAMELKNRGKEIFAWIPSITRGNYHHIIPSALEAAGKCLDGVLIGNLGSISYVSRYPGLKIMGDYSLNVFNVFSEKELSAKGLYGITLSPEMTMKQINNFESEDRLQREIVVYGRIPVMTSEYCHVGSIAGGFGSKSECSKVCVDRSFALKDRKGIRFPVFCDRVDCRSIIFNSNVIFIADEIDKLNVNAVDILRLNITDEAAEAVKDIIAMHSDLAEQGISSLHKYGDLIDLIKRSGFTRGHYFRGVI
ncbi:MAG TPA: U32 family peptidase [Clostridiaceae bacterium]|nr:U32 family peptidase [Clostridiaceae bacterium]